MSRAFVKETDDGGDELPERPVSQHPNFVTADGLAAIEAELTRLQAELDAAGGDRATERRIGRDLRYWRARRAGAEVTPPPPDSTEVRFGATVTVVRDDGRIQKFRIVGEDEADPAKGSISYVSPLARALLGKAAGDVITVAGQETEISAIE